MGLLFYLTTHLNTMYVLHSVISDQQGRYIVLYIFIFQQRCALVTLYDPNTDSPEFFTNMKGNLINWELSNEPIILCGDWNVVLNYHNDSINYLKESNPNAQKSVLELMDTFELGDVYRGILVYNICLVSISSSVSDGVTNESVVHQLCQ